MACAQLIEVAALLKPLKRAAVVPGRAERIPIDAMIRAYASAWDVWGL